MFAEADYSEGTTASMLCNKIQEFAKRIKQEEQTRRIGYNTTPQHLV